MQLSSAEKALYVKLVYYGPGLSGKTTNIETIHRLTDPQQKQPMVSLRTEQDRTLFFDLLPFDLGKLYGLDIRLKLYTVPGQIQYDTTRKQVLAGADGVVFVADSHPNQRDENARMVRYLKNNLMANGLDPATIPLLFQWNKRDLVQTMSTEEMDTALNWRKVPAVESVATVGTGVMETFREITVLTLDALARGGRGFSGEGGDALRQRVDELFDPFIEDGASRPSADPVGPTFSHVHQQAERVAASEGPERHREVLGLDDLLSEAVQANLAMSEQLATTSVSNDELLARHKRERKALARMLQIAQISTEPDSLYKIALSTLIAGADVTMGSALIVHGPARPLREIAVMGAARDPLNSVQSPGIGSVATALLDRNEAFICHDIRGELLFGQVLAGMEELRAAMTLPIAGDSRGTALFLLYATRQTRDLSAEDLEFAQLITSVLSLALRAIPVRA